MAIKTQLAVLGGGPGGYAAAFYAADHGLQTVLIDLDKNPGGVCLYRGCIPSKALLHIAKLLNETEEAKKWGVEFQKPIVHLDKLRSWKESVVAKLTGGLGQLSKQRKINYIQGKGEFINGNTIKASKPDGSTEIVEFENAIIATGSLPFNIPALSINSKKIMDSTEALNIPDIPNNLLIIGGGYIGLELGSVYAALGSKITVVEMLPQLLAGADRDLANVLIKKLESKFESILLNTKVVSLKEIPEGIEVKLEGENIDNSIRLFDKVLISIGRTPNSKNIGLENTKVKINEKGFIEVNPQRQTNEPSIYAIGDVIGNPMLAHKATAEGKTAVDAILGGKSVFEPAAIPAVVFTDPELAWCGLTETDAKERGIKVGVGRFPWAASGRALTLDRTDGITKIIVDAETERVLGVGIVGPNAGDLISEGALAVEMAALAKDVALTIHPHPTLSETMMEAAEVYFGYSPHLYRPKRN